VTIGTVSVVGSQLGYFALTVVQATMPPAHASAHKLSHPILPTGERGLTMIEPVVDSATHTRALRRIEKLWDAKPGSRQERELDALATLVDAYERRTFPIKALTPTEAIILRCEQVGWSRKDLEPLIGSRARVSETLTGRRPLTLPMIRSIHQTLGIPAEILISETRAPRTSSARGRRSKPGRGPVGPSVARAAQPVTRPPAQRLTPLR
jgi:HTH-type transcriptional regulator / antitoxin HigA